MNVYKIGDRVRVVKDDEDPTLSGKCGIILSIDADDEFYPFEVQHDAGDVLWHGPHEVEPEASATPDVVSHPAHYTAHPSGVECIQVTEHMGFNLGNAVKYIWRCDLKRDAVEDLEKARWYIDREIAKRVSA